MTYQSTAVLDIAPDFSAMTSGLMDDSSFQPVGLGQATPWKITTGPRRTIEYPFSLVGRAQIAAFRRFVALRTGALLGFWLPIYLLDYALISILGSTVIIEHVGLEEAVSDFSQFGHMIFLEGDTLQIAKIASVTSSGSTETITLTAPLASTPAIGQTLCGGLMMARFADDQLTYAFQGTDFAAVKAKFLELPGEYNTVEAGSAPLYLYKIERGGQTWRLAGWGVDLITSDAATWLASDITRGEIKSSVDFLSEQLTLTAATDDPDHPFRYFLDPTGSELTTVTIYEVDANTRILGDPIYIGQCASPNFKKRGVIEVDLTSIMRIAEQTLPRIQVRKTCNHVLYDQHCGLLESDFTTSGTLTAVSSSPAWIEAAAFGAEATARGDANWFALGRVTIGNQVRQCVGQTGNRLFLNGPLSAVVGDVVQARAGCDKRIGTCDTKFNNVVNFLGFPYVPSKNPQFEALQLPKSTGGKKS